MGTASQKKRNDRVLYDCVRVILIIIPVLMRNEEGKKSEIEIQEAAMFLSSGETEDDAQISLTILKRVVGTVRRSPYR